MFEVGLNEIIVGAGISEKPPSVAVPPGVVTDTIPSAPAPTTAVIIVEDITVKLFAGIPPKLTADAPVRFNPVIVTVLPVPVAKGVKEIIDGAPIKVKPDLVAVPPNVVTEISPLVPAPTTALICVEDKTV